MLRALLLSVPLSLAACDKPADKPAADGGKRATSKEAPKVSLECKADADCKQTRRDLEGDDLCCRGCGRKAVNQSSYEAFDKWCDAQGKDCPDMKCNWAEVGPPVCVEGTCKLGELQVGDGGTVAAMPKPPAVSRECVEDGDCEATSVHLEGDDVCCFACGSEAVSKTSLAAFDRWCDARADKPECPEYKCDFGEALPVGCVEGTCQFALGE